MWTLSGLAGPTEGNAGTFRERGRERLDRETEFKGTRSRVR